MVQTTKMNDRDRENLKFLLSADKKTLAEWYSVVSEDDRKYAAELLAAYSEELTIKLTLLKEPPIDNTNDAAKILKKFTARNEE